MTGVDGGEIPDDLLMIDECEFIRHDFREPYKNDRRYSLAMSLECAEHIPEANADELIDSLTSFADMVMFSAAIPHQRGKGHINEQYQTYWIGKFNDRGYQELDVIRPEVWDDRNVRGFYAENIFLYVKKDTSTYEALKKYVAWNRPGMYNAVHPQVWENVNGYKMMKIMDSLHENRFVSWIYYKFFKK